MEKEKKAMWLELAKHLAVLALWLWYAVAWALYVFGKVGNEQVVNAVVLAMLATLMDVLEEVRKKPPTDVTVEMQVVVDRPARVLDVKTKLNGKEPTSGGRIGSPEATKVEEDRNKMN